MDTNENLTKPTVAIRRVLKFTLYTDGPDVPSVFEMPESATIISAGCVAPDPAPAIWVEVDAEAPLAAVTRRFVSIHTGKHLIPEGATYVATTMAGHYVSHIYELV